MERLREILQREIYWANLGPVQGHEQAGLRPVIIAQDNPLNRQLSTVIIIPMTSNLKMKDFMTTYFLTAKKTQLKKDSVALLAQVRTIDKRRLIKKVGEVDEKDYFEIRFKLIQNVW